ncbi:hypothetical protein [Trinickia sp. EG282A]|uniref:hypothetical protein n=1 Tax=Trinickia sp. EG282A TaxID=3237013 RepID=UPI0034D2A36C
MPRFRVAHVREQGIDLIIVPLAASFGQKANTEQREIIAELQGQARSAGLAGTVVPVWSSGGRSHFIAPSNWHPFFRSLSPAAIEASINKEIYW